MKNNLENSIKESLKDFEMPYDPAAWTGLSEKLDQVNPVSKPSNLKWYLGGAASVILIATTIALWPSEDKQTANTAINSANNNNKVITNNQTSDAGKKVVADNSSVINKESDNKDLIESDKKIIKDKTVPVNVSASEEKKNSIFNPFNNPTNTNHNASGNPIGNDNAIGNVDPEPGKVKEIVIENIANFCHGDVKKISNKNTVSILIVDPNDNRTIIPANKSIDFISKTDGKHLIGYMENGLFVTKESFLVLSPPKADFEIDDYNKYENGIPSVNLSATTPGVSYTWNFEGQKGSISGKDVSVHYFYKDNYTVSLTVQGSNGCEAKVSKELTIEDNYNLFATNTLDLNSNDNRINMFMPYALTIRSVDFKMTIIDPADGAIIFETSDATNGWRGIDKRNGQTVESGKTFIWVVQIANPVRGEKSEYKGTFIKL